MNTLISFKKIIPSALFILLVFTSNRLYSEATISTYSYCLAISKSNLNKYYSICNDFNKGKSKLYRQTLLLYIDSILAKLPTGISDSTEAAKQMKELKETKARIHKNKKISDELRTSLLRQLFFWLCKKHDSAGLRSSSFYETSVDIDIFLDTISLVSIEYNDSTKILASYLTKKRNINPFSFSKTYPLTRAYSLKELSNKPLKKSYEIVDPEYEAEYIKEVNARLENLIHLLNAGYVIIKIETYYP